MKAYNIRETGFDMKGYITNIQHYSLHDGPGIRTLVFLKGCPLSCRWCSNPETQDSSPEIAYNSNKCIGIKECKKCLDACIFAAIGTAEDKISIDRSKCEKCNLCVHDCPSKALHTFGELTSVKEIIDIVEKDSVFYGRSGGGLTISGGEPLNQSRFTIELLKEAKKRRINTAIETCGYADWTSFEIVAQFLDNIMFDIKCISSEKHKEFTGVNNEVILDNFNKLSSKFPDIPKLVRTPVIPGFNDSEEDIEAIVEFLKNKPNVRYELLEYHPLGRPKYEYLGRKYLIADVKVDKQKMVLLNKIAGTV